jgi:hypothetical protein
MLQKLNKLNPNANPNVVRILIAAATIAMFVLSAGAPQGYGG